MSNDLEYSNVYDEYNYPVELPDMPEPLSDSTYDAPLSFFGSDKSLCFNNCEIIINNNEAIINGTNSHKIEAQNKINNNFNSSDVVVSLIDNDEIMLLGAIDNMVINETKSEQCADQHRVSICINKIMFDDSSRKLKFPFIHSKSTLNTYYKILVKIGETHTVYNDMCLIYRGLTIGSDNAIIMESLSFCNEY